MARLVHLSPVVMRPVVSAHFTDGVTAGVRQQDSEFLSTGKNPCTVNDLF